MKKIYIVSTPYHLLISITKTILAKRIGKDFVFAYNFHISSSTITNASKFFARVYSFSHLDILVGIINLKFKICNTPISLCPQKKRLLNKSFYQDKDVYIFNDNSFFGCMLNNLKINYNLIEDGLNGFSQTDSGLDTHSKLYAFLGLSWNFLGFSKYTKSIEVNDKTTIHIKHPNIEEVNRERLFKSLSRNEIDSIADLFNYRSLYHHTENEKTLLLTQPLSEDGIVTHSKKIEIYRYIVNKYAIGTLYIKAHPREKEDYSTIFPNAVILGEKKIPFEIIQLKENLHFKRVLSTFTSAMDAVFCADEKIQMGLEWVKNFK